ncbi:MAG: hypothetical protein H7841_15815 [Magnetospirillum sp. WYHS-4]
MAAAKDDPVYSISGTTNRARPYEPARKVFGRRRIFPDVAAEAYVERIVAPAGPHRAVQGKEAGGAGATEERIVIVVFSQAQAAVPCIVRIVAS